jgi:hypothetical protein
LKLTEVLLLAEALPEVALPPVVFWLTLALPELALCELVFVTLKLLVLLTVELLLLRTLTTLDELKPVLLMLAESLPAPVPVPASLEPPLLTVAVTLRALATEAAPLVALPPVVFWALLALPELALWPLELFTPRLLLLFTDRLLLVRNRMWLYESAPV